MASNNVVELNEQTFDSVISSDKVVVDFWAPWCGPCRMQTPIMEEVAEETGDDVTVAKVNVDEAPGLAGRYGVRSIPTIIVFEDGKVKKQFVGVQQAADLIGALNE